jgi:hypothetical protein
MYPGSRSNLALLTVLLMFGSIFGQLPEIEKRFSEETIENKVPKHLPIKVEILYGKGAHVLENTEIKVTNTGKRPIYYLDFIIQTGRGSAFGRTRAVSWIRFGRDELRGFAKANSGDGFLTPGESYVFQLSDKTRNFRAARRADQVIIRKYELIIQVLSFGDGTGYTTTGGVPYPEPKASPAVNATDRRNFFWTPI